LPPSEKAPNWYEASSSTPAAAALAFHIRGGGGEIRVEDVDDLVLQPVAEAGDADARGPLRPANAYFEPTGMLRPKRGIANEGAGEETEKIEEGRTRYAFAIGAVQTYSRDRFDEDQRANRRRIGEFAEVVMAHRQVRAEPFRPLRPPLADKGGERAGSILVAEAGKASSPEILFLAFDRCVRRWPPKLREACPLSVRRSPTYR
jgi:hypothetical protein